MRFRTVAALGLLLALTGCGEDQTKEPAPVAGRGHWKHCRVEGFAGGTGLSVFGGDLIAVAGGGDRNVYTLRIADLEHEGSVRAQALRLEVREKRRLLGSEPFAQQGYTMKHLWSLPVDFQGVAVQAPDFVYLGERSRRVVFYGRLMRDAAAKLASVTLTGLSVAPGADRAHVDTGDWRDHGPGLAGLLALSGRRRVEDLYVLERAPVGGPALRIYRMDRLGSALGSIPVKHDLGDALQCNALSWDGSRFVIHYGKGRGRLATMKEPEAVRSGKLNRGTPGPDIEGVEAWVGMTHGEDGTVYLVSNGEPAYVAWRTP